MDLGSTVLPLTHTVLFVLAGGIVSSFSPHYWSINASISISEGIIFFFNIIDLSISLSLPHLMGHQKEWLGFFSVFLDMALY